MVPVRQRNFRLPAVVSIESLRLLNTYESAGVFEGRYSRLDDLILQHLHVQRELMKLNAFEECVCRMMAEGYNYDDIAEETGVSRSTVGRFAREVSLALAQPDL
jgi:DNA-binding NarL/FixJ family response regulator